MHQMPQSISQASQEDLDRFEDPIIQFEDVMWAARRFILIYGGDAPFEAEKVVSKMDLAGKLHVAEMFSRVREECVRLLKCSDKYRMREFH
ncbi:hypothetical protein [Sneathiella limimaris]|uniref:hypothetical protein n=1 Tax=Sneathiella limimaris TaxID=1964213 RepID=UPI00146A15E7|nr:hypothetical protein [Sneathiella limimaris]